MRTLILACVYFMIAGFAQAQPYTVTPGVPYNGAPTYVAPAPAPDYRASSYGYTWRDQRGDTDWRNNTWREDRRDENWRNDNWQTRRELQDWQQRQDYSKTRTPNNATDEGYVQCGKGSVGSSTTCGPYVRTPPTKNSGTNDGYEQAAGDAYEKSPGDARQRPARGVEDCGHGEVWRRCK
jgi:hypothetical protein